MAVDTLPAPATPAPSTGLNPPPPAGSAKEGMFSGLNKIAREPSPDATKIAPAPAQKKTPAVPEVPKKPEEKAVEEKEDEKPVADPEAKTDPKIDPKAPPATPAKPPSRIDHLRGELAKVQAERDTVRAEVERLKKPVEDPEKKTLSERLAAEEKRRKEIEDELRFTNYERSPEFKEKYVRPYNEAWAEAMSDLEETVVPNADGTMRKATKDDLMKIVNMPIQQAGELAEQLFGKAERTMMDHRSALLKTWKAQQTALTEGRKMAEQREKELTEQQARQQSEMRKIQAELRVSKEPDFLKRHPELEIIKDEKGEPADKEFAEMLQRDRSVTDNLFNDDSKLAPEKKLELHSEMRNRAAHFGAVLKLARKALADLAEANKKLAEYEGSEPNKGEGNPPPPPELAQAVGMNSLISGLTKIAREKVGPPN